MNTPDPDGSRHLGKVLFLAVNLAPPGGGQCVGAWALQALLEDWDVHILCVNAPDYAALNRHFGTCLEASACRILQAPWLIRQIARFDRDPQSFQGAAWLMRRARKLMGQFDLTVSVDNEMDFGRRGIQYVHYPYLARHKQRVDALRRLTWLQRLGAILAGRYRPWMVLSGISFDRVLANLTLVNSHWTARLVSELYGVQPIVLYPPVIWSLALTPWSQRTLAFVSLGRIESRKRQMEAIDILDRVRRRGYPVQLEIIGDVFDHDYAQQLAERAGRAGSWVRLHQGIDRSELEKIVNACRYGLHTMRSEHFGIAVAELLRAGCIVFTPNDGGQIEIIGEEAALMYGSDDQAVERICAVLESQSEQQRLLALLAARRDLFTETLFMSRLRQLARDLVQAPTV